MKIRNDYVTNSSSSSFILAFKNEEKITPWGTSWQSFERCCDEYSYDAFYKLIKSLSEIPENTDKERALTDLKWRYEIDKHFELMKKKFDGIKYENYFDRVKAEKEYKESQEYKDEIQTYLEKNEEYQNKKKQIEEADLIVCGMIWDSSGGLLEWAIRNGFIESEFRRNAVIVWNVG